MAGKKIRGITIELGADYSQVTEAFNKVTKQLSGVDKSLKDVNKLLKLDPSNVELLTQKQGYLEDAIALTSQKLLEEQQMLEALPKDASGELTEEQKALSREIEATKIQLDNYQKELEDTSKESNTLGKETKGVESALKDAGKETVNFGTLLQANLTADAIVAVGKAVIEVGKQIWNLGTASASYADGVLEMSSKFSLSTDTLQEFMYMAELTDTSLETITGSLTKLTNNMNTASKGTGDAYEAFKALGISVTDSSGQLRNSEVVFNEAINALGQIENTTQRDAYALKIFGRSAMELNPLIEVGADGIAEYAEEARQMGYVLDEETLGALGNVDDSLQRANKAMDAVKNQIGTQLAPVIADITTAFAEWAMGVDWKEVGETIGAVMKGIGKAINALIPIIKTIIEWAGKVVSAISAIFSGKFEFPKIKLPHFALTPKGWKIGDLLKGSIPKLSIDWYAKGYDGMVLDGATIFGMNKNGQLMAGGERGREIIIGEKKLNSLMGGNTINVVVNEAVNAQETAQLVMNKLQLAVNGNERVWK